ncbi:uncharacterized protein LOC130425530 [Triplophysa dalaica]|uniref:uncharacterized protein LOC130425530 n=1 Tax=Triplophysa dalaica TaxID=1582913 RepID=UPI0024DFE242|nr:uncharacterized protein LOC130425530 [Triplophysa dalaica]
MFLHYLFLISILLRIAEGFTVKGPSGPLVVPLGGSVLLPCSVDSLSSLKDLEVEWKRSDSQTLIHLYQDGDIRPEVQNEDYHDRAHFFTDNIKQGNFSLLLKNVRPEDEGQYTCKVLSGQASGETVVEIKAVERLTVSGSDKSLSAYVGEDVTLDCSVDSHIQPEDIEEVSWKKTDKDEHILVLLYQNHKIHPEASDAQYRHRVEFFNDEIHRGNFSLRLKRVRTEDKGEYMCQVFAGRLSDNTTVILKQLGFSSLHIMVLILCIFACGSALLFFSLIYCRPQTGLHLEGYYWVPLGASAVLPCFNNKYLPADVKKVKWSKSGLKDPLCVFEDGEVQHPASFSDRANFLCGDFTLGNFSLLLKNVRTEDKGRYTCTVHSGHRSVLSVSVNLEYYEDGSDVRVDYSWSMVVPLGASVLLPCVNDKPLTAEGLKVEWKKSDSESPMFVYQDERSKSYSGRAHFSTDDIKHGIFSLLLKNVTAQDEGEYTCEVYRGKCNVLSVTTTLELRLLDRVLRLQMFLVVCPNLIMFFAFVFWGVSEGSVYETVFSCALYVLRPLMLLFVAPYKEQFKGTIKTLLNWSLNTYYISFTTVLYSVLIKPALEKSLNYSAFDRVMTIVLFIIVLLLCLAYIIYSSFIVALLPVITSVTRYNWNIVCGDDLGCSPLVMRLMWMILMCFMNSVLIYFYIVALQSEKDLVGWACTIGFLQLIWTAWNCLYSFQDWGFSRITIVYVFGSVGVILISAVGLMTELTLKTLNGEGLVGDLRIIVFSSESLLTVSVLIMIILAPCNYHEDSSNV